MIQECVIPPRLGGAGVEPRDEAAYLRMLLKFDGKSLGHFRNEIL